MVWEPWACKNGALLPPQACKGWGCRERLCSRSCGLIEAHYQPPVTGKERRGWQGVGDGSHAPLSSLGCLSLTQPTSQRPRKPVEVSTLTSRLQHRARAERAEKGSGHTWKVRRVSGPLSGSSNHSGFCPEQQQRQPRNRDSLGLGTCPSPAPGTRWPGSPQPLLGTRTQSPGSWVLFKIRTQKANSPL